MAKQNGWVADSNLFGYVDGQVAGSENGQVVNGQVAGSEDGQVARSENDWVVGWMDQ
jgi:hypothetical protein